MGFRRKELRCVMWESYDGRLQQCSVVEQDPRCVWEGGFISSPDTISGQVAACSQGEEGKESAHASLTGK